MRFGHDKHMAQKILIVEDDPDVRDLLSTMMMLKGWDTDTAEDGRQALDAMKSNVPDAVLCDVMMPEVDGLEVFQSMRANPQTMRVPFVFVTALSDPRITEKLNVGLKCAFVRKPFTMEDLERALIQAKDD